MPLYKIYTMYSMCIFNTVKKQSIIGFIVDAMFGYFAYIHSLYTVVDLHTNFVLIHFGRQPYWCFAFTLPNITIINKS